MKQVTLSYYIKEMADQVPLELLGLSNRTLYALKREGFSTLSDLFKFIHPFYWIRGIGRKGDIEIRKCMTLYCAINDKGLEII